MTVTQVSRTKMIDYWKTSFEKNCFSTWASTLNMGLINKGWYGMFVTCGIWCLADVSRVSPSADNLFRNSWISGVLDT